MSEEKYTEQEALEEANKMKEKMQEGASDYNEAEKIVIKDQDEAGKEKEKLLPIYFIYRDNDLFNDYIPEMTESLKALGRDVRTQSFPVGTGEDEIKKWYAEHKNELNNVEIVSDWTAQIPSNIKEDLQLKGVKEGINLYDALNKFTAKLVLGEEYKDEESVGKNIKKELTKALFVKRVKDRIKNPEDIPEKVYIFLDSILDHNATADENHSSAWLEKERKKTNEDRKETEKRVAEELEQWLIAGGIDKNKIIILDNLYEYTEKKVKKPEKKKDSGGGKKRGFNWEDITEKLDEKSYDENGFKTVIESNISEKVKNQILEEVDQLKNWVLIDTHAARSVNELLNGVYSTQNLSVNSKIFKLAKDIGMTNYASYMELIKRSKEQMKEFLKKEFKIEGKE